MEGSFAHDLAINADVFFVELGITDKTVLVTGGTRGIGESIAKQFLEEGVEAVTITGTRKRHGWWDEQDRCRLFVADFKSVESTEQLIRHVQESRYDVLVNNAGILTSTGFVNMNNEAYESLFEVNVMAVHRLIQAVVPGMKDKGWGRILNVSSIASQITRPGMVAYVSSKAALEGLTRSLAMKMAPYGILVNAVGPAFVETDMLRSVGEETRARLLNKIPLNRFGSPADTAYQSVFLSSDRNQFITGQSIYIDGGASIQ